MNWNGVMPAMTTAFDEKDRVDAEFMSRHAAWMVDNGCTDGGGSLLKRPRHAHQARAGLGEEILPRLLRQRASGPITAC